MRQGVITRPPLTPEEVQARLRAIKKRSFGYWTPPPPVVVARAPINNPKEEARRRAFRELHQSVLADILAGKKVGSYY